jgi:hypothetical protein
LNFRSYLSAFLLPISISTSAHAANLLFESDFGGTVAMGTPTINSTSGWWPILGGDDGFSWPISIDGGSSQGFQPISYGPTLSWNSGSNVINCGGSPCWKAEIIQGTRHDGTTGPILHRQQYQNMYWQFPYVISPGSDVPDQYQHIEMMLPANLASTLGPNSWYTFAEWKTTGGGTGTGENYDYRIAIYIYTDSNSKPYWFMTGTEHSGGPYYWTQTNNTYPVPLGQWFSFEWAWHRTHDSSSWTWVKINGTKIMEQDGGGSLSTGFYNTNAPIDRIFLGQMYGAQGATDQWTDHIEIWDSVPSSTAPTDPPTTAPAPTAPAIASSVTTVPAGCPLTVTWSGTTTNSKDWIGLYPVGQPFYYPLNSEWSSTNCTQTFPTAGISAGSCGWKAWSTPGQYQFRFYNGNTIALEATSQTVTVGPAGKCP